MYFHNVCSVLNHISATILTELYRLICCFTFFSHRPAYLAVNVRHRGPRREDHSTGRMSFHQDALPHRMRAIQQPLTEEPPAECQCCSDDFLCDVLTCSSLNESQSSISVRSSSDTSSNHLSNSSTDLITTRDAEGSGSEVLASADNEPVSSGTPTGRTSPQSHPPNKRHQHRHKYLADAVSANHDEGDHNASDIVCNEANEFNSNGKGKMKTKLRKSKGLCHWLSAVGLASTCQSPLIGWVIFHSHRLADAGSPLRAICVAFQEMLPPSPRSHNPKWPLSLH